MKKMKKVTLALCAALGFGGCGLDIPDLNRPSLEDLENRPTRALVLSSAVGLQIGNRVGIATQNGYVSMLGILGRESYVLDRADPRYVGEMLAGASLDPGSPAFGGNFWTNPYSNIRNANLLLNALDKVADTDVNAQEKEALRGFAKTYQALDFLVIINTHDTNGAAIDVSRPFDAPLAPIESKEAVFAHIVSLLDQARTHLQAGGTAFPIRTSSGLYSFEDRRKSITVPEFIQFNRALRARVDVYRKDWAQALTDLEQSFLGTSNAITLDKGVYYAFGTGSGDTPNELANDRDIYVHPSIIAEAEKQVDGSLDARVQRKVIEAGKANSWQGVSSDKYFVVYTQATSPVPIIRNEELLLIRAEAYIGRNAAGDEALALADLNTVRAVSGGLPALPAGVNLVDALLKERRYSLLFEGGHRWIDARRYGKLNELPKDVDGHRVHSAYPIPTPEVDARK